MAKSHPTGDPPGQQQVGLGKSYPCKPFLSCSAFTNSDLTAPLGSAAPNKLYQKHTGLQPPEHEHPHCELRQCEHQGVSIMCAETNYTKRQRPENRGGGEALGQPGAHCRCFRARTWRQTLRGGSSGPLRRWLVKPLGSVETQASITTISTRAPLPWELLHSNALSGSSCMSDTQRDFCHSNQAQ